MTDKLKLEKQGRTAVITLQNPPANTWTTESLLGLRDLVEEIGADKDIYTLILASESEKFFSAGADLKHFNHNDKSKAGEMIEAFGAAFEALARYPGVSIAAITGFAMGGGLEVTLSCDIRVAEQQAQLALPECSVGLLPGGLGTQQLPWLVGEGWAKRMILLGQRIDAATAERIGLVQEVVDTGKALETALVMADQVAKQSPTSVRLCKQLIMGARKNTIENMYVEERERFVSLWDTEDRDEGVAAFVEKRKPEWKNR